MSDTDKTNTRIIDACRHDAADEYVPDQVPLPSQAETEAAWDMVCDARRKTERRDAIDQAAGDAEYWRTP